MRIGFGNITLAAALALVAWMGLMAGGAAADVADTGTADVVAIVRTSPEQPAASAYREARYTTIVIDEMPDQRLRVATLPNTGLGFQAGEQQNMAAELMLGSVTLALGGVALRHMSNSEAMIS